MSLVELNLRANIQSEFVKQANKEVVIYEDHRYLLNVLFHARRHWSGFPSYGINLIYFDQHDDGVDVSAYANNFISTYRNIIDHNLQPPPFENSFSFVEFQLSGRDDDWLKAGFELGLINDAILIGGDQHTFESGDNPYTDHTGYDHNLLRLEPEDLRSNRHAQRIEAFLRENQFIVDFDLDFFTEEGTYKLLSVERMIKRIGLEKIQALILDCQFVTIAKESEIIGFKTSQIIFDRLNEILFGYNIK